MLRYGDEAEGHASQDVGPSITWPLPADLAGKRSTAGVKRRAVVDTDSAAAAKASRYSMRPRGAAAAVPHGSADFAL